jgi:large subunit ribosomal protein L30
MSGKKQLKVTLTRSINKALPKHKATVKGLGLRRMHHTVILEDTACVRGMVKKVDYLLSVEEA